MRRWPLLLLLAACGGEDDAPDTALAPGAGDSVVWGEDRARRVAGTADRLFLERLLDHYQGLEYLAERVRRTSNGSAVRRDAWRFERREGAEREQVDALLRERYGERYLPRVPEEFRAAAAAIRALPPERQARALLAFVSEHHREDVARIDSILPALQSPQVRELARELRRDPRRDLRVFARRLARD
ncbi:MAG: hypothetical protein ACREOF_11900 [Gemmatimonadales bacterium]